MKENPKIGESLLSPMIEMGVEKVYDLEINTPSEVVDFCSQIKDLGGLGLLVGGSVRDAFISQVHHDFDLKPKDWDIEVYGIEPSNLKKELERIFGKVEKDGESFPVYKVRIPGTQIDLDISIPRRESSTGPKHNDFVVEGDPSMTILEAGMRRDLMMNAMSFDPIKKITYVPPGSLESIKNKTIEVTNENTFIEDPLRVFRIIQFASRFDFKVSQEAFYLCSKMVQDGMLDHLPSERITEEFEKLLVKGLKPSVGLEFAKRVQIVKKYWPELDALIRMPQEKSWHPEGDVWQHTMQVVDVMADILRREGVEKDSRLIPMLSALLHDVGKPSTTMYVDGRWRSKGHEISGEDPAINFLSRFTFNRKIIWKPVVSLIKTHMRPMQSWLELQKSLKNDTKAHRNGAARRLSSELRTAGTSPYWLTLLVEADQRGRNGKNTNPLEKYEVEHMDSWQHWYITTSLRLLVWSESPKAIFKGDDVKSMFGLSEGPWVGAVLKAAYAMQLKTGKVDEAYLRKSFAELEKLAGKIENTNQSINSWVDYSKKRDPLGIFLGN